MDTQTSRFRSFRSEEGQRFQVGGSDVTYKLTAEHTGGAYSLAIEVTAPQAGFPLHVHHAEDEVMYILEGDFEVQCGDQVFRAGPGDLVFLPRSVPNRYQNCGEAPGRFVYITSPSGFENLVAETSSLMARGAADPLQLQEVARRHQVDFVDPGAGRS